jgi:hypothetical protein
MVPIVSQLMILRDDILKDYRLQIMVYWLYCVMFLHLVIDPGISGMVLLCRLRRAEEYFANNDKT